MTSDLPIAVRVYPDLPGSQPDRGKTPQPDAMLVFDCETRTDETQALTFGSYRFLVGGQCREEGLFYADDLTARERATLERYAQTHGANTEPNSLAARSLASRRELKLLHLPEFLRLLYKVGYKGARSTCRIQPSI